tara:strand:- start:3141 stop:4997 length:1857 start_codon:yes stop_codon:yes gene_type:complete
MNNQINEGAARYTADKQDQSRPEFSGTQGTQSPQQLLTDHLDLWTSTVTPKSTSGRGSNSKIELTGIKKLRELILELAVRGKLVAQNPDDEPASKLLECIEVEKDRLSKEEGLKTKASDNLGRDEEYIEVPSHWSWARLGNLAKFIDYRGKTPKKIESGIRLITAKNIRKGYIDLNPEEFIAESDYDSWMTRGLPRNGDMLFTTEAPMGNAASINLSEKFALAQRAICFQWHSSEISEFMLLQVLSGPFQRQLSDQATGMTATGIKASKLKEIPVTLPPLAEQQRIVAKVDELMALCDQLEQQSEHQLTAHQQLTDTLLATLTESANAQELNDNWQRLANHFDLLFSGPMGAWATDRLKDTILQLAVMGKLVPQNPDDEPASKLLERIEEEKARLVKEGKIKKPKKLPSVSDEEKPFELPEGWEWTQVAALISGDRDISYGIIKLEKEPKTGGVRVLRCSDVRSGYIDRTAIRSVSPDIEIPYQRTRLQGGEVLLNIRGTLGGVAVVTDDFIGANIAREVAMLAFSKNVHSYYMQTVLLSPYFWGILENNLKGIAYKGLNLGTLREILTPLPPLAEQQRIVAKVDELFALCDQLKDRLQQASETEQHMTNAIVEQALN